MMCSCAWALIKINTVLSTRAVFLIKYKYGLLTETKFRANIDPSVYVPPRHKFLDSEWLSCLEQKPKYFSRTPISEHQESARRPTKMTDITLKVKSKCGEQIIRGLSSNNTLSDLRERIGPNCGSLMSGYPPRALLGDSKTLTELGIKSGDTLIAQENHQVAQLPISSEATVSSIQPAPPRRHTQEEDGEVNGLLMRQVVPSDNSCLFTSVGFVLSGSVDVTCGTHMRKIIAEQVSQDEERYSEAILGQPNKSYCAWIQKPDTWGGAIELAVLSEFYDVEIAVVDTINAVINRFGEDKSYPYRAFLIFDGIHYDPLYKEQSSGSIQTMFPSSNEKVLHEAAELAKEAKSSRQYTDVARFTIRCLICRVELIGEAQAQKHAQQTGHLNFGEVAS